MGRMGRAGGHGCPEGVPDSATFRRTSGGGIFNMTKRIGRARQAHCLSVISVHPSAWPVPCLLTMCQPAIAGTAFSTDRAVVERADEGDTE